MTTRFKRALVGLVAFLLASVGGLTVASPAQASSAYGCPDGGYICFYNYESFNTAGGIYAAYAGPINTCRVLPTSGISGWTNGKVYNATSSILFNWTGQNVIARTITFYDASTCSDSDYKFASAVWPGVLDTDNYRLANIGWNDRIGSFKVQ
jgi:hypothetical protein